MIVDACLLRGSIRDCLQHIQYIASIGHWTNKEVRHGYHTGGAVAGERRVLSAFLRLDEEVEVKRGQNLKCASLPSEHVSRYRYTYLFPFILRGRLLRSRYGVL